MMDSNQNPKVGSYSAIGVVVGSALFFTSLSHILLSAFESTLLKQPSWLTVEQTQNFVGIFFAAIGAGVGYYLNQRTPS
jgi:hypothetical protein